MNDLATLDMKSRKRLMIFSNRLLDPDWPGLCPAEIDEIIDILQWPLANARSIPDGKEVKGRRSPRSVIFSRRPRLSHSIDDTLQMLPYCWDWYKHPAEDGVQFVILDPKGVERSRVTARHSARPHGLRLSDGQALAAAILAAIVNAMSALASMGEGDNTDAE